MDQERCFQREFAEQQEQLALCSEKEQLVEQEKHRSLQQVLDSLEISEKKRREAEERLKRVEREHEKIVVALKKEVGELKHRGDRKERGFVARARALEGELGR